MSREERASPSMPTLLVLVLLLLGAQRARVVRGQNGAFQIRGLVDESPGRMLERHQYEQEEAAVLQSASSLQTGREIRREEHHEQRVFEAGQGSCGFPDTRADADECMADLAKFPALSARSGSVSARKLACLAHNYLRPWMGIPGVTAGMGARGMINPAMLQQMGTMANVSTVPPYIPSRAQSPPRSSPSPALPHRFSPAPVPHIPTSPSPFPAFPPPPFLDPHGILTVFPNSPSLHVIRFPLWFHSCRLWFHRCPPLHPFISFPYPYPTFPILHPRVCIITFPFPPFIPTSRRCANGCVQVLSCAGHVRIVRGKIFFRFGNFEFDWYRLRRFVFSVKLIQTPWEQKESRAVFRGGMTNYKVIYPKHWRGSPRFRVHRMSDVRPDLLDARVVGRVDPEYRAGIISPCSLRQDAIAFGKRLGPAELQSYKYQLDVDGGTGSRRVCGVLSSSQMLIKQASEHTQLFDPHSIPPLHPSLAPFLSLSLPSPHPFPPCRLRQDSISFGKRLGPADLQSYKYELDVDGGAGSGRMCGVLSSSQMLIKQASEYTQFFDPLMCPYRHFLPTHRFFSDLFGQIEWARQNDGEARRIVRQANELASDVCTFDGRRLYWAILLAKYSVSALEDNRNITQPPLFTCTAPPTQGDVDGPKSQTRKPPPRWPPRCDSVDAKSQPPCTHYCIGLLEDESKWKWLSVDALDGIEVYKPRNKHIKFQGIELAGKSGA
ncbi:unnamed protein product [Closterium sp. NIES-65]|nr:unnamed protein product [Closterium sp. NIES-65]